MIGGSVSTAESSQTDSDDVSPAARRRAALRPAHVGHAHAHAHAHTHAHAHSVHAPLAHAPHAALATLAHPAPHHPPLLAHPLPHSLLAHQHSASLALVPRMYGYTPTILTVYCIK